MSFNRLSIGAALRLAVAVLLLIAVWLPVSAQDSARRKGFEVSIVEPENQGVVFGKTKIRAEVRIDDPARIDRVEFIVGDETIFIDNEAPFETFYDFGEASKSWVVRAVVYHVEGITVSDAIVTRKIPFSMFERVNRVVLWVSATDKKETSSRT